MITPFQYKCISKKIQIIHSIIRVSSNTKVKGCFYKYSVSLSLNLIMKFVEGCLTKIPFITIKLCFSARDFKVYPY